MTSLSPFKYSKKKFFLCTMGESSTHCVCVQQAVTERKRSSLIG